jgi:hypothetical protein
MAERLPQTIYFFAEKFINYLVIAKKKKNSSMT